MVKFFWGIEIGVVYFYLFFYSLGLYFFFNYVLVWVDLELLKGVIVKVLDERVLFFLIVMIVL